jgi:glycosyltransferase involved in cell wall biosynthesis
MIARAESGLPLRLLLVTETFPPEVNGVARTLGRWVETFRDRGHIVQLIRPRQPSEPPLPEHVHGIALPFYSRVRLGVASPLRLRGLLDRYRPDLVHIATEGPLGAAALVAAVTLGLPVASSFHTNFDHYLNHYGLGGLELLVVAYLRWFHNSTLVTLVPSESTRRRLQEVGLQRVEIWSRGVDGRTFHPCHRDELLRRSLGLAPDDVLLLYVGRLALEKNLPALMQAYGRLRERLPTGLGERVRLALVGDGPLLPTLQMQGQAGVILAGEKHGQELSRWYASADVFAFPSCSETFGNVVLEAQASGLPVVAFDAQAMNERIVSGADGFLVACGGDLAVPLLRLCEDQTLRRQLGVAARAKAEKQSWTAIFDDLEARYLDLITEHRCNRPNVGQTAGLPLG